MVWKFAIALATSLAILSSVIAQGNCTTLDLEYICQNTGYVQSVSADCGLACLSEGEECLEACMVEQLELSLPCIGCFGEQVVCVVQQEGQAFEADTGFNTQRTRPRLHAQATSVYSTGFGVCGCCEGRRGKEGLAALEEAHHRSFPHVWRGA